MSSVRPSAKNCLPTSIFFFTLPDFNSTRRSVDSPYCPVLSSRLPSWKISPCVKAFLSCGHELTTSKVYSVGASGVATGVAEGRAAAVEVAGGEPPLLADCG